MGMSASQARLLTLTMRMSDLELQAQQISNAKIRLSQNSQEVAETYNDALSKETLQVYSGVDTDTQDGKYVSATAYNLTTYGAISSTDTQRLLRNSSGQILVSESVKKIYDANQNNLNGFLLGMGLSVETIHNAANQKAISNITTLAATIIKSTAYTSTDFSGANGGVNITATEKQQLKDNLTSLMNSLKSMSKVINDDPNSTTAELAKADKIDALVDLIDNFINGTDQNGCYLSAATNPTALDQDILKMIMAGVAGTAAAGAGIASKDIEAWEAHFSSANGTTGTNVNSVLSDCSSTEDTSKALYYTNLFNQIKAGGGCFTVSDAEMNSADWLYAQLSSGGLTLVEQSTEDSDGDGENDWGDVSWSSGDSSLKSDTDDEAIAKAEAKYDSEMAEINTKDQRFDLQLKNVDTEHNAIQTEYDTVQKVIEKNIERSFKLFNA